MIIQQSLEVQTRPKTTHDLTREVQSIVRDAGIRVGIAHVFCTHTSASLMLCENADPAVREDLESFMARLAPDDSSLYLHRAEGPDDMPAHIRSVLTHSDLTIPIIDGACALGTWQGIYLWEHRDQPYRRKLIVTVRDG
jgi:secondary thiamine-phosphate synthase enzyme